MIDEKILKSEERAIYRLRTLYGRYGYLPFKMSKFEEYDLYLKNKDFLIGENFITFNDTDGTLLALKPDVTLSIIKNIGDKKGIKEKVYYSENVYRVSGSTRHFKEIMQTGLECIGDIDIYDTYEVVSLAAMSLAQISDNFVLDISHMGIFKAILDKAGLSPDQSASLAKFISEKNRHEAKRLLDECGVSCANSEKILSLVSMYGQADDVLKRISLICDDDMSREYLAELESLCKLLASNEHYSKVRIDFSVVNDMNYYNGIVFRGFISDIPEGVLSGGRYDSLMRKMGKSSGAIGFALYLDLLEGLDRDRKNYDVDVLLIYDNSIDPVAVSKKVDELTRAGFSVCAQKGIPQKLRYKLLVDLTKEAE